MYEVVYTCRHIHSLYVCVRACVCVSAVLVSNVTIDRNGHSLCVGYLCSTWIFVPLG